MTFTANIPTDYTTFCKLYPKGSPQEKLRTLMQATQSVNRTIIDMGNMGKVMFSWNDPKGDEYDSVWIEFINTQAPKNAGLNFMYVNANGIKCYTAFKNDGIAEAYSVTNARLIWEKLMGEDPTFTVMTIKPMRQNAGA